MTSRHSSIRWPTFTCRNVPGSRNSEPRPGTISASQMPRKIPVSAHQNRRKLQVLLPMPGFAVCRLSG